MSICQCSKSILCASEMFCVSSVLYSKFCVFYLNINSVRSKRASWQRLELLLHNSGVLIRSETRNFHDVGNLWSVQHPPQWYHKNRPAIFAIWFFNRSGIALGQFEENKRSCGHRARHPSFNHRFESGGSRSPFLFPDHSCNLILLNSLDSGALLSPQDWTSPFITWRPWWMARADSKGKPRCKCSTSHKSQRRVQSRP